MNLLLDTLAAASATAVAAAAYWLFRPLPKKTDNPDSGGAYEWAYDGDKAVFLCHKCTAWSKRSYQPAYCECAEYPDGHYHFQCKSCEFACIMRTHNKGPL